MGKKRAISFDPNFKNRGKGRRRGKVSLNTDDTEITGSVTFYGSPEIPEGGYIITSDSNTRLGVSTNSATPIFWTATDDTIVSIVNGLPGNNSTFTTSAQAFDYLADNDYLVLSQNTSDTTTDGLVLELDASKKSSYAGTGNDWYDISGNGHKATLNNGPTLISGSYISFDGVNDYAPFTSEYSFSTGDNDYTFEVLFKMRTLPTAQYGANGHIWGGENGNDVVMYLNPASGGTSRGIMVHDDSRYNTGHMTTGGFEADTWAHWVAVGDSTNDTITHYINGKLDRENGPMLSTQTNRTWGGTRFAYDTRWGTYSTLDLAVARQYNRQLTAEEVAQNFYKGKCATSNLEIYYDADNLVSTQDEAKWYDISGNGRDATKTGSPTLTTLGGAKCWNFTSTNQYFDYNNNFTNLTACTLEAWIYPAASEVSSGDRGTIIQGNIYMSWNKSNRRLSSYWYSTNNRGYHEPSLQMDREEWYHLITIWNGSQLLQYIDGELVKTTSTTISTSGDNGYINRVRIGMESSGRQFAGGIGMIKVYSGALTTTEVFDNFNSYRARFRK